jgi:hypothetical protein
MLIVNAAVNQIPVYYVGKGIFDELRNRPVDEERLEKFDFPLKDAIFLFPENRILDEGGDSVDWLIYHYSISNDPLSIRYRTITFSVAPSDRPKITWCSTLESNGSTFFVQIDPGDYRFSLDKRIRGSADLSNIDDTAVKEVSKLLVNILQYMETEIYEEVPLGFSSKHKLRDLISTRLLPNWVKPKIIREFREDRGGHHRSPIPHTRREHTRRIRDSEGNVVKTINVRRSFIKSQEM